MGRHLPYRLVDEHRSVRRALFGDKLRISVAFQAVLRGHPGIVEHAPDLVRLVAVHAGRDLVRLFLPQAPLDDPSVHLFDPPVALHAGAGDVVLVDAGSLVRVGENEVRRMTRGAHGRDRQSLLEQPRAVNGERVVFEDPVLRDIEPLRHVRPFLMALAAQEGDVHHGSA